MFEWATIARHIIVVVLLVPASAIEGKAPAAKRAEKRVSRVNSNLEAEHKRSNRSTSCECRGEQKPLGSVGCTPAAGRSPIAAGGTSLQGLAGYRWGLGLALVSHAVRRAQSRTNVPEAVSGKPVAHYLL